MTPGQPVKICPKCGQPHNLSDWSCSCGHAFRTRFFQAPPVCPTAPLAVQRPPASIGVPPIALAVGVIGLVGLVSLLLIGRSHGDQEALRPFAGIWRWVDVEDESGEKPVPFKCELRLRADGSGDLIYSMNDQADSLFGDVAGYDRRSALRQSTIPLAFSMESEEIMHVHLNVPVSPPGKHLPPFLMPFRESTEETWPFADSNETWDKSFFARFRDPAFFRLSISPDPNDALDWGFAKEAG